LIVVVQLDSQVFKEEKCLHCGHC